MLSNLKSKISLNLILTTFITVASAIVYFVFGRGYWAALFLLLIIVFTRFNKNYVNIGKLAEIILVFCFLSIAINEFGINYPYSLILILTGFIVFVFLEGPEWNKLYFSPSDTRNHFKLAVAATFLFSILFVFLIYFNQANLKNPVPLNWPVDALIILGFGYAFFMAITEEIIFRSIIFQRLESTVNRNQAIFFQGLFYGLMWYKIPAINGAQGVVIGTLFGLVLGYLTKKSNSIYLSMFVHFFVTLFIYIALTVFGKS